MKTDRGNAGKAFPWRGRHESLRADSGKKKALSVFLDSAFAMLFSENEKGAITMRGYFTAGGYYGLVNGQYRLFASESEYYETMEELG